MIGTILPVVLLGLTTGNVITFSTINTMLVGYNVLYNNKLQKEYQRQIVNNDKNVCNDGVVTFNNNDNVITIYKYNDDLVDKYYRNSNINRNIFEKSVDIFYYGFIRGSIYGLFWPVTYAFHGKTLYILAKFGLLEVNKDFIKVFNKVFNK